MNRLFVLSFKSNAHRISQKGYFLPTVEIKEYNVIINGRKCFDQPLKDGERTYDNIRKITNSQGDHCITGCLLNYLYLKKHDKMIAIDLGK